MVSTNFSNEAFEEGCERWSNPLNVKSLSKAFRLLEVFRDAPTPLGLAELVQATGMDKSTVQRFTFTLKEMGYLEQDPDTRRYVLGRRVLDLTFGYLHAHPLVERASPVLVDLRRSVQERVDMTVPDGDWVLYVVRMQAKRENYSAALIGRRIPMFCSAGGRAMLSALPEEEALQVVQRADRVRHTPNTLTDVEAIMREVRAARERGYALQVGEWRAGEIAAAVPIVDKRGVPIAAVHVAVSIGEWTREEVERRIVPLLMDAGAVINKS
ncbi:IclR family transcriptional regulator [Orrella sp. JC864]|uniref:IclR family transcriptional regulator n=1 Tax=Orrella sp. JC864 TaxID=3120298 RepID=UPI0030088C1B